MWHCAGFVTYVLRNFYSHIPCGMWPDTFCTLFGTKNFYSHIPCGMWRVRYILLTLLSDFYSHIPCGMWRCGNQRQCYYVRFLLTHPVWDVTQDVDSYNHKMQFLLTHPVWDVTIIVCLAMGCIGNFYSHIPCGMWLENAYILYKQWYFYSHIPCGMWLPW